MWQENFARYIFQETGYIPDLQSLKLALLLQKQFRNSPWNKARLGKGEEPEPLPELPFTIDEIRMHAPEHEEEEKATTEAKLIQEPLSGDIKDVSQWAKIKEEMGPFWKYRQTKPINWVFTPEPQPDPAAIEKFSKRIESARSKAGRRKTTA